MSKDLLAEATRALRETEPITLFEARAARAKLLASLQQRRVRRRTQLAFVLPIAASFVAVSAWGAASGQARLALEKLEHLVGITPTTPTTPSSRMAAPKRVALPLPSAAPDPEPAALVPNREAEPVPAAPSAPPAASSAAAIANGGSASKRAERLDPALALYRSAHAAHFVDHDPARALAAWDAYLSAAPKGEFAPEARYNRALSLVRLGRGKEARSALTPFANGAYGDYRRTEASTLLQRIEP